MDKVKLKHDKEKLIVAVVVKGVTHYEHIMSYFEGSNAYDNGWIMIVLKSIKMPDLFRIAVYKKRKISKFQ